MYVNPKPSSDLEILGSFSHLLIFHLCFTLSPFIHFPLPHPKVALQQAGKIKLQKGLNQGA
jgi:hypothetical protein